MIETTWGGFATLLGVGLVFGLAFGKYHDGTALRPWTEVGSSAYVQIINESHEDVTVTVYAPKVDGAKRIIGTVPRDEERRFKLPYVDTEVHLVVASVEGVQETIVYANSPKVWKVIYK